MKIYFKQTGGVVGISVSSSIDTDLLAAAERQEIQGMIQNSNFFHLKSKLPPAKAADYYSYSITIENDLQIHTIEITDLDIFPQIKPLIKFMSKRTHNS